MTALARPPMCDMACPVTVRREVWRIVPFATGGRCTYSVSSLGRVRNAKTGRLLRLQKHATGYTTVNLGRACRNQYVHRLVALAFFGPPPRDGFAWEVDHLDFNKRHNTIFNLRWLHKDTNQWRWKFWTDIDPAEEERVNRRYAALVAAGEYEGDTGMVPVPSQLRHAG